MLSHEKGLERLEVLEDHTGEQIEVILCRIPNTDLKVEMIRKNANKSFLPGKIFQEDKEIWNFKQEELQGGIAKLVQEKEEGFCVTLIRKWKVERALPVSALPAQRVELPKGGESYSSVDMLQNARLKLRISKILRLEANLFPDEKDLLEKFKKIEEKEKEKERQAKKIAKEEKVTELLNRKRITAITVENEKVWGTPASEDEWKCLRGGHKVILVEDPNAYKLIPIEAFIVEKQPGGKTRKKNTKQIKGVSEAQNKNFASKPVVKADNTYLIQTEGEGKGKTKTVLYFNNGNLQEFTDLLSPGSLVTTSNSPGQNGKYQVFKVKSGKLESYGYYQLY